MTRWTGKEEKMKKKKEILIPILTTDQRNLVLAFRALFQDINN